MSYKIIMIWEKHFKTKDLGFAAYLKVCWLKVEKTEKIWKTVYFYFDENFEKVKSMQNDYFNDQNNMLSFMNATRDLRTLIYNS